MIKNAQSYKSDRRKNTLPSEIKLNMSQKPLYWKMNNNSNALFHVNIDFFGISAYNNIYTPLL
ncbi:hypothetical protein [Clostridium formicaceticum]|uniref:hypothetical protein n=1 Tax=Clostridium formicaceticum TaxID=1497 RepID=UPI0012EA5A58|nr:hypothetical protein [Clostridium formicaceticum]